VSRKPRLPRRPPRPGRNDASLPLRGSPLTGFTRSPLNSATFACIPIKFSARSVLLFLLGSGILFTVSPAAESPAAALSAVDIGQVAAAGISVVSLYMLGLLFHSLVGLPAPVGMLFFAVAVKVAQAASPEIQQGSKFVYKFTNTALTFPMLFAVGLTFMPWDTLVAALAWRNLLTIACTVASLMATGFVVARWVNLYPIEAAIVNACHSGQGSSGDVAILTAANRMQMMPFAQIATRIGGAITVTLALIALAHGW